MQTTRAACVLAASLTIGALAFDSGCGSSASATSPSAIAPSITALTPTPVVSATLVQLITVQGKNFLAGLTVTLIDPNGVQRTFENADIQTLQANSFQIATLFPISGTYQLIVKNPGGEMSDAFTFTVSTTVVGSSPHINSVTPSSATHGPDPQNVSIDGTNFDPNATVTLVDPTGQATTMTPSVANTQSVQLGVVFARVGTYTVSVTNPDGQVSNSVSIAVF